MKEIMDLLARMRQLEPPFSTDHFPNVSGPTAEGAIRQLEEAFGWPMPPSYRAFLAQIGSLSIVGLSWSGIMGGSIDQGRGCAWNDTRHAREWCHLPVHYLVVQADEDGFTCLDFSRTRSDGEHPVIYHMPFRTSPFAELAPSYGRWLAESLRGMVLAWEEDV